jgi:hypothetical protein
VIGPDGRYARLAAEPLTYVTADGKEIKYLGRRFLAPADSFETLAEVEVQRGDRLDLIAARSLGAAEAWWRIAEANETLDPRTLTETPDPTEADRLGSARPARRLRIPVPRE